MSDEVLVDWFKVYNLRLFKFLENYRIYLNEIYLLRGKLIISSWKFKNKYIVIYLVFLRVWMGYYFLILIEMEV